jgi:hypothetical protein
MAVNYSSDREGADRVSQAIIDSRGKAIASGHLSKAAGVGQLFKEVDSGSGGLDITRSAFLGVILIVRRPFCVKQGTRRANPHQ